MMLELLAVSALRSMVFGGVVGLGLKLLRVRNPHMQMAAWTVVLVVSLAMPALTPWMRVTIPSPPLARMTWTDVPRAAPAPEAPLPVVAAAALQPQPDDKASRPSHAVDWSFWARCIYVLVAGAMVLRLLTGLMLMWHVRRAARPIRDSWAAGADVRVSSIVAVPVTFASTILLPAASTEWNARKLQAVLVHERSHVVHGDFFVLLLASFNRTVFWFNPFAWWLSGHLASLAETVSDDAAIEALGDRRCYADVLLDMAINPQLLPAALAMADPHTVRRRVERILAATTVPARSGRRRRLLTAIALAPLGALSAVSIAQSAAPTPADLTMTLAAPSAGPPTADLLLGISATQLDGYVGQFETTPTSVLTITRDGKRLFAQSTGQPKLRLFAVSDHEFVDELGDAHVTFMSQGERPAAAVVLRPTNSGPRRGARIDAARATEIEAAFQRRIDETAERFRDQAPVPGGKAAVRQIIEDLSRSTPTYQRMAPWLTDKLRRQLPQLQTMLRALGAPESIYFRGVGPGGYDIYGVKFANGTADFRIDLTADGTIKDVLFHPGGDGTVGGIASCALEATLKSSQEAAPITLTLTNRSGADFKLFSLDPDGKRVASGVLATGRSLEVPTSVDRPLVVADQAGQCREIVLPGHLTRLHVVEPPRSAVLPGPSAVQRITPVPGSEEILRQHIEGIRRGAPDYDRMTPEAAAATRQLLPQQRAILARLGALRAISFRGVGLTGEDIYEVLFANGSAGWQISLLDEGRIRTVSLGP
jgi:hypothetical protein